MADSPIDYHAVGELLSGGGAVVLSILVYLELRALRPIIESLKVAIVALLERDRERSHPFRRQPTPLPDLTRGEDE